MQKLSILSILLLCSAMPARAEANFKFKGFTCSEPTCEQHRAGYKWAMQKRVRAEKSCVRKSQSFFEGCEAWVRYDRGEKELMPKKNG